MSPLIDPQLLPHTRVHPIALLPQYPQARIWLKREDEAGFAVAGGKKRKFASLIPYLKANGYTGCAVIGGANSNNVLAALQLLREAGITPILFRKAAKHFNSGNDLLTRLLGNPEHEHVLNREEWPNALPIAREFVRLHHPNGGKIFCLPEGSDCFEAFPGAMTLADDLQRNERETGLTFDHIFMDAGLGHSAAAAALGLAEQGHTARFHVVLMAEDESAFGARMASQYRPWHRALGGSGEANYRLYRPRNARSFGSVNRSLLDAIHRYAREFGVLTEPIYSAKLLLEAESLIPELGLEGNVLIVHSGGAQTLAGFAGKLFPERL